MTERWIPKDKAELMSAIDREWDALLRAIEKLPAEKISAPDAGGWSPKDHLAHLAGWMKILMEYHLDKRPRHEVLGISEEVSNKWDFNDINQLLLERNKARAWDDARDELRRVYAQTYARIEAMSFETDLLKPYSAQEPLPILAWVIGNTVEHFAEHRRTLANIA